MSNRLVKELKCSNYRLLGLVGQGQFGRVYCATHRKTGRLFALKELDRHRFSTHKFLRELRFLLSFQHANIVTCYALEHTPTGRYLVMDYCEGGTLRNLMQEDVRLHPVHCLKLVADVLAGLDHAHNRGIVHCDIKPENILLTLQAYGWTARLSDFGIARLNQETANSETGNTGSPAYMAPERFYGQHFHSSDLYSVGVLLFELLVGYRPFSGTPTDLMTAHLNQPVKVPDTISAELRTIILTALQKLPARRFRSSSEMLSAVQAAHQNLRNEVNQSASDYKQLQPLSIPSSSFNTLRQQDLQSQVRQLVGVSASLHPSTLAHSRISQGNRPSWATDSAKLEYEQLYQVFDSDVECQTYPEGLLNSDADAAQKPSAIVSLPGSIKELLVRPQGCFAVTQNAVYLIPATTFQPEATADDHRFLPILLGSQPIQNNQLQLAGWNREWVASVEAQGRWMATAAVDTESSSVLSIWRIPFRTSDGSELLSEIACGQHVGDAIQVNRLGQHIFQLIALDRRYIATFSYVVDQRSKSCPIGVLIEVFDRRGHVVGSFNVPVPFRYITACPQPYRFMALDPGYPDSLLLIDLQPLRMLRIGLDIVPTVMAATDWGYVLISEDGRIVVLDQYGQGVGCTQGPAHPTAITVLGYALLIATWNDGCGKLYTVDLQQLDLGILF